MCGVGCLALAGEKGAVGAAADAVEETAVEGAVAACGAGVVFVDVVLVVVGGEVCQTQRGVECFASDYCAAGAGAEDGFSSA